VYTGSAGLAFLTEAGSLLNQSLSTVSNSRVTFLCGSPGTKDIQCVIQLHQKLGQYPDLSPILTLVLEVCDLPSNLPGEERVGGGLCPQHGCQEGGGGKSSPDHPRCMSGMKSCILEQPMDWLVCSPCFGDCLQQAAA